MYTDQFGEFVCGYWSLKGLRVFSSKWEAAYSLYQIHPYPLPVKRKSVTPCMLNYGNNIFFFRDGYLYC